MSQTITVGGYLWNLPTYLDAAECIGLENCVGQDGGTQTDRTRLIELQGSLAGTGAVATLRHQQAERVARQGTDCA